MLLAGATITKPVVHRRQVHEGSFSCAMIAMDLLKQNGTCWAKQIQDDPSPFSQLQANSLRLEDGKPVWAKSNWFWILQWCWIEFYCWLMGACTCSCPRFITTIFTVAVVIIDHGKGFETSENNYTNVNLSSSLEREEKRQPIQGSFQVGPAIEGKCVSPCFPYHLFSGAQCSCCDRSTRSGPLRSVAHSAAGIPLPLQNLQNSKSLKFRWFRWQSLNQSGGPSRFQ